MKNENAVNGRAKGLQQITRLGVLLMTVCFAATSAQAVSGSKSAEVGNSYFGATASVSFNDSLIGSQYRATLVARADGKVLTKAVALGYGASTLEIQPLSKCHAYGSLKLGGVTIAQWDKSFTGNQTFTSEPLVRTLVGGSKRFWIGPVPVKVSASAKGRIYARGSATVSSSPPIGTPVVRCSLGPVMDISANASVGVDLVFAGAELNGSLTLIGMGLTGDITYTPQLTRSPVVAYRATADIYSTDGALKVCAWIDPPIFSRSEWCETIYEYHGGHNSYVIASGSHAAQPILKKL